MTLTYQSEVGKLKSVLVKNVRDAFRDERTIASEWKVLNFLEKPDLQKALSEYQVFEGLLTKENAQLNYLPPDDTVSMDSLYCRDAAIATDAGIILCNMGKPARKPEPDAERKKFEEMRVEILGSIQSPGTIEGGDVAWLDTKTLAVGHTYRTNENGIRQLEKLLAPFDIEVIAVPLPHYKGPSDVFHLMSILSPVDHDLAVVYSPLMPIKFRNELLDRGYNLLEVPDLEFESMGCNVLAIAPRECIIVQGNPITKNALEEAGATVYEYAGTEISVKGGGGPTCLTRPLLREV